MPSKKAGAATQTLPTRATFPGSVNQQQDRSSSSSAGWMRTCEPTAEKCLWKCQSNRGEKFQLKHKVVGIGGWSPGDQREGLRPRWPRHVHVQRQYSCVRRRFGTNEMLPLLKDCQSTQQ